MIVIFSIMKSPERDQFDVYIGSTEDGTTAGLPDVPSNIIEDSFRKG